MTDRERLIELLTTIKEQPRITCPRADDEPCEGCQYDLISHCNVVARFADYLIENGVTFKQVITKKGTTDE